MGGTMWSADHYDDRVKMRAATGTPTFAYDAGIKSGKTRAGVHDKLNPKGVVFRESRDSASHPESRAVAVLCDVTGSMAAVPGVVQRNLKKLMALLITKGYLDHPQILIGAVGDATSDVAPLQVGQFESGNELEDDLTNLYLEGGGGGQMTESYELAMYFMARHTALDCLEKRGDKGYLFIIGDEMPYPRVDRKQVEEVIGDKLGESMTTEAVLAELREAYEVFFVLPAMTSNFGNASVRARWNQLLPQRVITLDDPEGICECIAAQIGTMEGKVDGACVEADLVAAGTPALTARSVGRSLVPAGSGAAKGVVQSVPDSGAGNTLAKL